MMKNRFKILFARRNIQASKKNSIVVIITLSLIFCLSIMLVGLKSTATNIYELDAINKYENVDIVISYDEYSSSRLINKRNLEENYSQYLNYALSFFNMSVLVNTDTPEYFNMMSSQAHEFELLMEKELWILNSEVVITRSLSENYNLDIGDDFSFSIMDNEFNYTVGDIFEDKNQFSGNTFFVDKSTLMSSVYGFDLPNLGNIIYIDTADSNIQNLYNALENDSSYDDYSIVKTIDWDYIDTRANDFTSMFLAVGIIVILAVFLVLDSLFPNVSKDIPKQLGVVRTLGAKKSFVWHVYIYQWIIYIVVSFILGSILSVFVLNLALNVYGLDGYIPYNTTEALLCLLVISSFTVVRAWLSYRLELRKSNADLSSNQRYKQFNIKKTSIIIVAVIFLIELIFNFLPLRYHALIMLITSIYLCFNLMSLGLIWLSKLISKRKSSVFSIFQAKYLQNNKNLHQSLRVMIISLLALIMVFSFRVFVVDMIDDVENMMDYDLAVTNIVDYDDDLIAEFETYNVNEITGASLYNYTSINIGDDIEFARYMVSIDYEDINKFFNSEIDDFDDSYKDNEDAYILLPKSYRYVYNLEVGDIVSADINYELENVDLYVAGFIDSEYDNFVFTNITEVSAYSDLSKRNTIFINTDDVDTLYLDLINDFSSRMYYVINPDIYFEAVISSTQSIIDFFGVFTLFIISCFVIVIFNNTVLIFNSLKNDFSKVKSLGADRVIFRKAILKEFLLISSLLIFFGILEALVLSDNTRYLVLFTNYFKDITATPFTILISCVIVILVEFVSYIYYLNKINKIIIIDEIKK